MNENKNNNSEIIEQDINKEEKAPKQKSKAKTIKLVSALVVFLLLVLIIILNFRPGKFVSCITFLGNDIKIQKNEEGILELPTEEQVKRPGYNFIGWYTTDQFTEEYNADTFTGKKLYAKYERIIFSIEYEDRDEYTFPDEVLTDKQVAIWNPTTFFIKYSESIKSDEAATEAWGTKVGSETDRVSKVYIASPEKPGFAGWQVYKKVKNGEDISKGEMIATLQVEKEGYCKMNKDIILDYDNVIGVILVPIWN